MCSAWKSGVGGGDVGNKQIHLARSSRVGSVSLEEVNPQGVGKNLMTTLWWGNMGLSYIQFTWRVAQEGRYKVISEADFIMLLATLFEWLVLF